MNEDGIHARVVDYPLFVRAGRHPGSKSKVRRFAASTTILPRCGERRSQRAINAAFQQSPAGSPHRRKYFAKITFCGGTDITSSGCAKVGFTQLRGSPKMHLMTRAVTTRTLHRACYRRRSAHRERSPEQARRYHSKLAVFNMGNRTYLCCQLTPT